uniref:Uncharacterized protein n=1 Tax=Picea glauca TaxID=3330 RepID=A0A101M514_PICGL|nr:hypothetical protein ABT39_MTgene855 [Picea glauca]
MTIVISKSYLMLWKKMLNVFLSNVLLMMMMLLKMFLMILPMILLVVTMFARRMILMMCLLLMLCWLLMNSFLFNLRNIPEVLGLGGCARDIQVEDFIKVGRVKLFQ